MLASGRGRAQAWRPSTDRNTGTRREKAYGQAYGPAGRSVSYRVPLLVSTIRVAERLRVFRGPWWISTSGAVRSRRDGGRSKWSYTALLRLIAVCAERQRGRPSRTISHGSRRILAFLSGFDHTVAVRPHTETVGGWESGTVCCSTHTQDARVRGTATVSASAGIAIPESLNANPASPVTSDPVSPARNVGAYS